MHTFGGGEVGGGGGGGGGGDGSPGQLQPEQSISPLLEMKKKAQV